ncbi:MAG TPA: hypothetical protein VFG07_03525, partial [Thermoplasmata archaeon]|nr:hypothetical protein [Thermoplasmata archaeon]
STLVVDLPTLLKNDPNKTVDYLFISVVPVAANGTGLPGIPLADWPGNQTVIATGLGLSNLNYRGVTLLGVNNATIGTLWDSAHVAGETPLGGAIIANNTCATPEIAPLAYSSGNPTTYRLTISNLSTNSDCVVVELLQNYDPGWQITAGQSILGWTHVLVDGYANGFIVKLAPGARSVEATISFVGQSTYIYGVSAALGGYAASLVAVSVIGLYRRRTGPIPPGLDR